MAVSLFFVFFEHFFLSLMLLRVQKYILSALETKKQHPIVPLEQKKFKCSCYP
jgi:hypothetical protein